MKAVKTHLEQDLAAGAPCEDRLCSAADHREPAVRHLDHTCTAVRPRHLLARRPAHCSPQSVDTQTSSCEGNCEGKNILEKGLRLTGELVLPATAPAEKPRHRVGLVAKPD